MGSRLFVSRRGVVGILACVGIFVAAACVSRGDPPPPDWKGPVRIIGTLVAVAGPERRSGAPEIELPDIGVTLEAAGRGPVAAAVTRLDGKFDLIAPGTGRYRLCYEIAGSRSCGPTVDARAPTVTMNVVRVEQTPSIAGLVRTLDDRACWVNDSFFGLDVATQVSAQSGPGQPAATARANVEGEYALFGLPSGRHVMTARCEAAVASEPVELRPGTIRNLTLPNRAPSIRTAAAFTAGRGVERAITGSNVDLRAEASDPEGDEVEFLWRTASGSIQSGGSSARWQLPSEHGLRQAYLIVRDGRGGYSYRRVDLETSDTLGLSVSGQVVDDRTGAPVVGAVVTLGGVSARTDARGGFGIEARDRPGQAQVLNIRHPDYALLSWLVDQSVRGDTFALTRAQVSTVAADGPIRLRDESSGGLCGRDAAGAREQAPRRAQTRVIAAGPTVGETIPSDRLLAIARQRQPQCLPQGAEISIPAGALVDAGGRPATGPVRAAVTTLNPARRALPGDYRAVLPGGEAAGLLSFGAVEVELTDQQGEALDLRSGTAAEIRIPVPPSQAADAPPTMRMWSYDEDRGVWISEGEARLERTPAGLFYVGRTRHFSTINMDIAQTVAEATCVRVELDPGFSAWSNLVLRAYASFGGTSVQVKETPLDTNQYHGIFRLPYGNAFPPNTLRLELRGTFSGVEQVLLDDIVNTDARPQMTGASFFPPYPYAECGAPILLAPGPGVLPYYGDIDATGRPAFLTGPYGSFNPNPPEGAAYYAAIDPGGQKATLGDWWQANGFGADGQGAGNATFTRASYMNHNDLGFGRDMHCLEPGGGRLACYVTNYGLPDQNDQNANDAATRNPATQGATVTMEYDPNAGAAAVQFYVFGGGTAPAPRLEFADLDGLGPKPVPHLCMVCHGGGPGLVSDRVEQARFREFDLPSFRYPGPGNAGAAQSWDYGNPSFAELQANGFASLNRMVRDAHAPTPIGALINAWYGNTFSGPPAQPVPPGGWTSQAQGYHLVYGQSCRTCHIARDEGVANANANAFLVFGTYSFFQNTDYVVCNPPRRMPNAFITYKNFWADTLRVQQYEALTGATNCGS